jgi:succinyl-diaminopimelate desuccinylase
MNDVIELSKKLINTQSVTPNDNGCQSIVADILNQNGFQITSLPGEKTTNMWAEQPGNKPLFAFSGHTDTVPAGDLEAWLSPPFQASIRNNHLYGRGTADMKCAIAAMLLAYQAFLQQVPTPNFRMGFMLTSDEEGDATEGTIKIVRHLQENNIRLDWCLVGEASSKNQLGDSIKVGRRGSLHGELQLRGKQGHIAYPQLAENPIHRCFKALDELTEQTWDSGDEFFSPSSFQIYNIHADTGATNMIPGSLSASFNFRFSPSSTADTLKQNVHAILDKYHLDYTINWNLMSTPFLSKAGKLRQSCQNAIKNTLNINTLANTEGGTSDGRFIIKTNCEIVELGPINKTIHQVNECINLNDLNQLKQTYLEMLIQLNQLI